MRRPLAAALSVLIAAALGLLAPGSATAAPPQAKPKPTTKVVTAPIDIWKASAAQTPGGRLDYCAVTIFVVFPEIEGFEATNADYVITFTGATPSARSYPLAAPYDDQFSWGPLSRSAPAGKHQVMLGGQPHVWKAGSPDCEAEYATAVSWYSPTAQVTYEAVDKCAAAISSYNAADSALTSAKKRLDKARTPAQQASARAAVRTAKAKLAKAKKKYKRKC